MIRTSLESFNRITELSNQLDISKTKVIDMLIYSFDKKIQQALYLSLGKGEIKAKPLKGKKLNKQCKQ